MPTTYVLVITAPSALGMPFSQQDEGTIRAYLEGEALNNVKVCYVSKQATPHLSSSEFLGSLDFLFAPIQAGDWLVLIYVGLYQQTTGELLSPLNRSSQAYRLAAPFRDTPWLYEKDLVLAIQKHYRRSRFQLLVVLDAYAQGTDLALQHHAWSELQMVALMGGRLVDPDTDCDQGGFMIDSLFLFLSDIETNLMKLRKTPPSVLQAYNAIKGQLERESSGQVSQQNIENDQQSECSSVEEKRPFLRLYYSQMGEHLLKSYFPL